MPLVNKSPLEIPSCPECGSKDWSAGEFDCTDDGEVSYGCWHSSYTCNRCFYSVDHVWGSKLFDQIEEVLKAHYG